MSWNDTAFSLLAEDVISEKSCIVAHCSAIDNLVGLPGIYGISKGFITEISGLSGVGKTQLCLQLCYDVIVDQKKAIYVDTKGGFCIQRLVQILSERINSGKYIPSNIDPYLSNLFVLRITQIEDFVDAINRDLEVIINRNSKVQLIVIDTFSFLIKAIEPTSSDKFIRVRTVLKLLKQLEVLALKYNVAIVLVNDFTTKFTKKNGTIQVPSLGATFSHQIGQRIILSKAATDNKHFATLKKSYYRPNQTVEFQITSKGIENAEAN